MTRETKIGLLVGLAFIIVIGILLSDHLTTSTEPPTAPLARAGATARQAVTTIGQPTAPVVVTAPDRVSPNRPIVTREELAQPRPIEFAAPAGGAPTGGASPATAMAHAPAGNAIVETSLPPSDTGDALARLAAQHQGDLEVVGAGGAQRQPAHAAPVAQPAAPAAPVATRSYVAQAGDSVSRMAARLLGANTKANRDAIVRANPSLAADPNRVIVGRTYIIPTGPVPQQAPRMVIPTPASVATTVADARPAPAVVRKNTTGGPTYWYTVKENDSLWRIASEQLGTGNAYQQIKDLNKDVLKGGDSVRPNMRLRLPAKSVAAAE